MTNPRTAEASASGGRPIVLYKFQLFPDVAVIIPGFDAEIIDPMAYVDAAALEAGGWTRHESSSVIITYPGGLVTFETIASGPDGYIEQTWSGYAPGSQAYVIFDWFADGHWFEPGSVTITSGASSKSTGFNPPTGAGAGSGTKQTGTITLDGSGSFTVRIRTAGGYPIISHSDVHRVTNVRIYVVAPETEIPPAPAEDIGRTSFRRTVTYQTLEYTPCEIEHTEPSAGVDDAPGTIQISLPADDPISQEFRKSILPARPMVVIYQYHRPPIDEPDPSNVWSTLYDIVDTEHTADQTTLTCAAILGQMDMIVPSGLIQRDYCLWSTYDPLTCAVDPAAFTFEGEVSDISGSVVTVTGAAAFNADPSFFRLGSLAFGEYKVMIRDQTGDIMTLDDPVPGLTVGDTVSLWAGDDRTEETCHVKFANSQRRASFSKMPVSNPFYGRGLAP